MFVPLKPTSQIPGNYIEQSNKTGKRALHEAAQNNQVEVTRLLLKNGANVNSLKQGDWTPLMLATEKKNIEIVCPLCHLIGYVLQRKRIQLEIYSSGALSI